MVDTLLLLAALVLALCTALPLLRFDRWFVRIFDFPRLQIVAMSAAVLLFLAWRPAEGRTFWAVLVLTGAALAVQMIYVLPYTPLWRKETKDAKGGHPTLSLLMANVLMTNRRADSLVAFIREQRPDLVVLDEPDDWWEGRLREIERDYPHTMKEPRSNTYGMLLYSRLPFIEHELRYIVESEVPSFHVRVQIGRRTVRLHFVHPKPPFPKEATSTAGRDAELVTVGRSSANEPEPSIVAGDLNDVAWSHTTRLFQRISGLLDPRRGRGMFNTYHAHYWFARWPLDHVFHSDHFRLVRLQRGPAFGSDHFPMLIALELDPEARHEQTPPESQPSDEREADDKEQRAAEKADPNA